MTERVAEMIAANRNAEKIFIGNIVRDVDYPGRRHQRSGQEVHARHDPETHV
jgi:hypothetical protein